MSGPERGPAPTERVLAGLDVSRGVVLATARLAVRDVPASLVSDEAGLVSGGS